jgi:hypothetical protein
MPEIIETTVYRLDELSDDAKDKARAWFRETIHDDWWDSVYDDFERICPILGVTLAMTTLRLMGGGTRQKPCIWFSGFWSQGDGACFEGRYAYAPRASRRIRDYAPQDMELHRIADALQALQRPNFYQLTASFRQTGRYSHAYAMTFDVDRDSPVAQAIVARTGDDLVDALRDLAHWLYRALEREHEFQTSDETIDEGMLANGYTFTAEGQRFG